MWGKNEQGSAILGDALDIGSNMATRFCSLKSRFLVVVLTQREDSGPGQFGLALLRTGFWWDNIQ